MSRLLHNMIVLKGLILAGLALAYVVPHEYQAAVALSANCLWLFRT